MTNLHSAESTLSKGDLKRVKKFNALTVVPNDNGWYQVYSPMSADECKTHRVFIAEEEGQDFCDCKAHYYRNIQAGNLSYVCIHRQKVFDYIEIQAKVNAPAVNAWNASPYFGGIQKQNSAVQQLIDDAKVVITEELVMTVAKQFFVLIDPRPQNPKSLGDEILDRIQELVGRSDNQEKAAANAVRIEILLSEMIRNT